MEETETKIPRQNDPEPLQPAVIKNEESSVANEEEEEEEDRILLPTSTSRASVKQGKECPYLDTISRQVRIILIMALIWCMVILP